MKKSHALQYEIGPYRVDVTRRVLLRDGEPVSLTPKAFALLLVLLEKRGEVVDKEELLGRLWPDSVGTESNLSVNVSTLRRAFQEAPQDHRYVVTIPLRGYSFVAEVREITRSGASPAPTDGGGAVKDPPLNRALAVLPFRTLGALGDEAYLGLGLADALITELARRPQITVRSTGTVRAYGSTDIDPVDAARELAVDVLLEGTVQKVDDHILVTVQLVRGDDGTILWGERYAPMVLDVNRLQIQIARDVETALGLPEPGERPFSPEVHHSSDGRAFDDFLKGRFLLDKHDPHSVKKCLGFLESAVARDPDYAIAHAALAEAYHSLWFFGADPSEACIARASRAARRALAIDGNLAEGHVRMGVILHTHDLNWEDSLRHFQRAIDLAPNNADAHEAYAYHSLTSGQLSEGLARMHHARHLEPPALMINVGVGVALLYLRDYGKALSQFRNTLDMEPEFFWSRFLVGWTLLITGKAAEAAATFHRLLGPEGEDPFLTASLAAAEFKAGDPGAIAACIERLMPPSGKPSDAIQFPLALLHMTAGDLDAAALAMEAASRRRHGFLCYLNLDPMWDPLRDHPRFVALLRRLGFPSLSVSV